MISGRVNIICPPPRTDEVDPFFWPEPSYAIERQWRTVADSSPSPRRTRNLLNRAESTRERALRNREAVADSSPSPRQTRNLFNPTESARQINNKARFQGVTFYRNFLVCCRRCREIICLLHRCRGGYFQPLL